MLNANLFKAAIVRQGYTLGEFAHKMGISHNTLTSRISGATPFNVDEIDKACEILDLSSCDEICSIFLSGISQKQDNLR